MRRIRQQILTDVTGINATEFVVKLWQDKMTSFMYNQLKRKINKIVDFESMIHSHAYHWRLIILPLPIDMNPKYDQFYLREMKVRE